MRLFLTFLLLSFILTNCPTENDPNLVEMTASVNPEEVGVVNPPEGSYMIGRQVNIETEAIDDRYKFAGWSGDTTASDDSLSFEISRDMNLIANYEIPSDDQPVLVTTVEPIDAGIVEPDSGSFELGSSIDLEAIPNEGWAFSEWTGDTSATANPLTVTMDNDYALTAHFERLAVDLFVDINPIEGGAVEPEDGQFEYGSAVDVEAIPDEGWAFTEWSGDTSSVDNPLTVTMDRNYNLTANFTELSKAFSNTITISDGANSMDLIFGMDADATSGFDSGIDRELPPPPPEGSFYGQFNIPDYFLAEDYRSVQDEFTNWVLEAAPDSGQTLSLSWDFSDTDHVGSLTLTDDLENPSFEINMKSETSYEIPEDTVSILYIISSNEDNQR